MLTPCCAVVLTALGVGNAVRINQMAPRFGKLLFLAHKNTCFCNDRTLVHNAIYRHPVFPTMCVPLAPHTLSLLFLAVPLDTCSNHNLFHRKNGMPTCLDVFCLCDTHLTLSTLAWSNYSTVAMATCYPYITSG